MTNKQDKKGPELLIVDTAMLQGIDTIAKRFKAAHEEETYDFLQLIKTALAKYPSMVNDAKKIGLAAEYAMESIKKFRDLVEQIWPDNKKEEHNEKTTCEKA